MDDPSHDADAAGTRRFALRRLHSLAGVLPLGVFLGVHLWTNLLAVRGRAAFDHAVGAIQATPALSVVEAAFILAPLAFHAIYGVVLAAQSRPTVRRYGYLGNWLFTLQRVTGAAALAFIVMHLGQFRVPKLTGALRWEGFHDRLASLLGSPGMFAAYVLGLTACVFHFANGLWTASQTWGLAATSDARRTVGWLCLAIGVTLWVFGIDTLLHFFYRCGGIVPLPGLDRDAFCRDGDMLSAATRGLPTVFS